MPPFEHVRDAFLRVLLPPALLAAALVALPALIGWRARRRDVLTQVGAALGVIGGLALGCALNDPELVTKMPVAEAWKWLPLVTLVALLIGGIAHLPWMSSGAGWGLRGAIAANAGWLLTPADLRGEYLWAPLALGGVILAEWAVLEALAGTGSVPLLAALPAIATSVVLIHAGTERMCEFALMLAGSLAGVGVAAAALRAPASAASAGAAVIVPALLLSGSHDTESKVPTVAFVLVALAVLTLVPSLVPAWQRRQRSGLWAVQLILLLAPLVVAVLLAQHYEPFVEE